MLNSSYIISLLIRFIMWIHSLITTPLCTVGAGEAISTDTGVGLAGSADHIAITVVAIQACCSISTGECCTCIDLSNQIWGCNTRKPMNTKYFSNQAERQAFGSMWLIFLQQKFLLFCLWKHNPSLISYIQACNCNFTKKEKIIKCQWFCIVHVFLNFKWLNIKKEEISRGEVACLYIASCLITLL